MLSRLLNRLRSSFWLIPAVMTVAAVALAMGMWRLDATPWAKTLNLWPGEPMLGAEGARLVMSTIAGAMIGAASIVYSMTLVALSLANQSAGPRTLGELMRQRIMQISLGIFLATFVYALLVLRTIYGGNGTSVPNLSVAMAIALAIAAFCWLIYFIHQLSLTMQTDTIVARAADDLVASIKKLVPPQGENKPFELRSSPVFAIVAEGRGYVDTIDYDALIAQATQANALLHMNVAAGHFVGPGDVLAQVHGTAIAARNEFAVAVRGAIALSNRRTATQDPEYRIHLLVEIAARGLSPGLNDFFTAIAAVDHLGGALRIALAQGVLRPVLRDEEGTTRVVACELSTVDLIHAGFTPIRQSAAGNVPVALRVLETLTRLAACATDSRSTAALADQARDMAEAALRHTEVASDRAALQERLKAFEVAACQSARTQTLSSA